MDRREASPIETPASKASRDAGIPGELRPDAGTGDDQVATDKSSIRDKVIDIVCEQMGASRDKVTNETSFINDLGADSLDTVELVMEFEDEFDLNIPDEDAEKIQTVGDAIAYIESHT
jgi:acyl carrier protein